jgi:hypothetical protein
MTPFTPFLNNEFTSRDVKDVIVLHPLNKYFIQWSHNEKKVWKMSSYSIPSINTSYNEVTMRKDVEDVNTFIWCSSVSSLILFYIIPRIVNSSLKNIIMPLYEVFVEGMEDDDTFHNLSHCDLNVWSIYQNSLHSPPLSTESPLLSNDIRENFIYWSLKLSITKHRQL